MGEPMDRSRRVFVQLGPFEEAFPTLEEATIEYTESESGIKKRSGKWYLSQDGGLMECRNPRCRRGGYEFDREVQKMVREHATEMKIELSCRGDEGSPKGRRRGQRCSYSVEGTVTVKYKPPTPANEKSD
jgi:hypothetical protein